MTGRLKLVLLFVLLCNQALAHLHHKVLFLSSYNSRQPTFFYQINGLKSVFDTCNVSMDLEFMDYKRFNDSVTQNLFLKSLTNKLNQENPYDIIITADDGAFDLAIKYKKDLFPDIPLIFIGVNDKQKAKQQNHNPLVTGIFEDISMKETIDLMLKLFPQSNSIYAIADKTLSGQTDLDAYKQLALEYPDIYFKIIDLSDITFNEYKQLLREIPATTPVLLLSAYRDKNNKIDDFLQVMEVIQNNSVAPVFHLWEHGIGQGLIGGKVVSHFYMGKEAALTAYKILHGTSTSEIPVNLDSENHFMFDYNQLKRFDLKLSQLPKKSEILNKPGFLSRHLITILITFGIIIVFLIVFLVSLSHTNKRYKKDKIVLREQNEKTEESNRIFQEKNIKLEEAIRLARENELKFKKLFQYNPVPLMEHNLAELEVQLKMIKQKHPDVLAYLNDNPTILEQVIQHLYLVQINQATLDLLEYNNTRHLQNNLQNIFSANTFENFKHYLVSIANGERTHKVDTELIAQSGKKLWVTLYSYNSTEHGTYILALADLTALKEADRELKENLTQLKESQKQLIKANVALSEAKEKAEEASNLKSQFLQNMSHEIRTPLNGILGYSELITDETISNESRKNFNNLIQVCSQQLIATVEDILTISQHEKQNINAQMEYFFLSPLLNDLVVIFNHKKNFIPIELNADLDMQPVYLYSDKEQITLILTRLLSNAQKFTPRGKIELGYYYEGEDLIIYVKDTGIGIASENLERIFNQFTQEINGLNRKYQGLGLGLSISLAKAELIGASLNVTSVQGEGSTFSLRIPNQKNVSFHAENI